MVWESKNNYNPPPPSWTKKSNPPRVCKNIHSALKLIYYIYPNSIVFHENSRLITFIKNVCQWGMKQIHPPPSGSETISSPSFLRVLNGCSVIYAYGVAWCGRLVMVTKPHVTIYLRRYQIMRGSSILSIKMIDAWHLIIN